MSFLCQVALHSLKEQRGSLLMLRWLVLVPFVVSADGWVLLLLHCQDPSVSFLVAPVSSQISEEPDLAEDDPAHCKG